MTFLIPLRQWKTALKVNFLCLLLPTNEELCGKVIFSEASVILFTGEGVHVWREGACVARGVRSWGVCVAGGMHGWGRARLSTSLRTVGKRTVRILLECWLVVGFLSQKEATTTELISGCYLTISAIPCTSSTHQEPSLDPQQSS